MGSFYIHRRHDDGKYFLLNTNDIFVLFLEYHLGIYCMKQYIYIYVLAMIDVEEYSFTLSHVVSLYTNWGHSLSVKYSLSEEIFLFTYVFFVIICHRDQNLVQNIQCFIAKQWSVFILNLYKTFFVCFVHVSLYMYFCQLYCFVFEHVSVIVNV